MSKVNSSPKGKVPLYLPVAKYSHYGERKLGRPVDALALGGDEGRDKLR